MRDDRPLFTGSSAERADACPPSQALPHVRSVGPAAERGTWLHAFLASVGRLGRDEAFAQVPAEHRPACEAINLEGLPLDPAAYAAEVALVYDVGTGRAREVGRDIGREYGDLGPLEIPVTLDVAALAADGEGAFVADWKTGHRRVTPAYENWQLRVGSLALCRLHGRSTADIAVIYTLDAWCDRGNLDPFDFCEIESDLRTLAGRVQRAREQVAAGETPTLSEGDHCCYCPAYVYCPAKTALIRRMAADPMAVDLEVRTGLTPERARQAYHAWKTAHEVVKRVGDALYAYGTVHPFEVGEGVWFGPVETKREAVDGAVVRRVLTERYGAEIAELACSWDSTKAAIEEALRAVAQKTGEKLAPLKRAALAAIAEAGGVSVKVTATTKEHRPKLAAQPAAKEG